MLHAVVQTDARDEVRAMFRRVLAAWAMDTLSLRRRGLDRPCRRGSAGLALDAPGRSDSARQTGRRSGRVTPAARAPGL